MRPWQLALLLACGPVQAVDSLDVLFAGCDVIEHGAACAVGPGDQLVLFTAGRSVRVSVDGVQVSVPSQPTDGGVRLRLGSDVWSEGFDSGRLRVDASVDGHPRRWGVRIVRDPYVSRDDAIEAASANAESCAEDLGSLLRSTPDDAGQLQFALSRCHRMNQRPQLELAALEEAVDGYLRSGELTRAHRAIAVHTFRLGAVPDSDERAEAQLGRIRPGSHARSLWILQNRLGRLALRRGDFRGARRHWTQALLLAQRLDMEREVGGSISQLAWLANDTADVDRAIELQRGLVQITPLTEDSPCPPAPSAGLPATRTEALAWYQLMQAEQLGRLVHDPTAALRRVASYRERCGAMPARRADAALNLALAAWYRGELGLAAEQLAVAQPLLGRSSPRASSWHAEISGRVALASSDVEAATEAWQRELDIVDYGGSVGERVMALSSLGHARRAGGDDAAALVLFEEAHALLWSSMSDLPIGTDRGLFVGARRRLTRRHVGLLLEMDRPADALRLVRTVRARALASLQTQHRVGGLSLVERKKYARSVGRYRDLREDQRRAWAASWRLPADELAVARGERDRVQRQVRAALDDAVAIAGGTQELRLRDPASGELMLAWFPGDEGWIAFAASQDGVRVESVVESRLFGSFTEQIREADRILLLPWGELWDRPLHGELVDGEPLLSYAPVAWLLDLQTTNTSAAEGSLVVSDPAGDLPLARQEGARVAAAWPGAVHLTGAQATVERVSDALGRAQRLHYSGHGRWNKDPWVAGLPLYDGVLSVADVLALPRVPEHVVLSGCETGRVRSDAAVATLGVAQAFVVAGARVVIATDADVDDGEAAAMAEAIHAADGDLLEQLRAAQRSLRSERPEADWRAWRAWVP